MSDESITFKEDTEDLLYIAKKIDVDEFTYVEEVSWARESLDSKGSLTTNAITESESKLINKKKDTELGPDIFKDPTVLLRTRPFDFMWTYGCNPRVDILNLTDAVNHEILFASGHLPIMYDYCKKKMHYLEGHHYSVVALSIDSNGQYLVTADNGEDGFLNIWDWSLRNTDTGKVAPLYSMYSLYEKFGISTAAISPCARYIVTVGGIKEDVYSIDMWLWTLGNKSSDGSVRVPSTHGTPIAVRYNPDITEHIMILFSKQVLLLCWDNEQKKFTLAETPQIRHMTKIGHLTDATYVEECHECFVSSSKGCILSFSNALYSKPYEEGELDNNKIFRNACKISDGSIDCCKSTEGLIVVGDARGRIFFFNKRLMLMYWLTDFNLGAVESVSFNLIPRVKRKRSNLYYVAPTDEDGLLTCDFEDRVEEYEVLLKNQIPHDATINRAPFITKDFFVSTGQSNIYVVDVIKQKCVALFPVADGNVVAIETHKESDYIIIAYRSNRMILLNYITNEVLAQSCLPKSEEESVISCLNYDAESLHLVCGKTNGEIWVLEPVLLTPKQSEPFQITKHKVVKCLISSQPFQFAYFDDNRTIVIFQYNKNEGKWEFKGKIRPHYGDITDILFLPDKVYSKLYSIAEDRHIIEYNNDKLDTESFAVKISERVEQTAIPKCMIYWVTENEEGKKVGYLLVADDHHKLKFLYLTSKVPKSTVLAPAFGCFKNQIMKKMQLIPGYDAKFMAFSTTRHCGIQILPPDGNPYTYVGYLTHPVKLEDFALSKDGKYIFTFGSNDHCVFKWGIETKSVEIMKCLGGKELDPFYCLIEGGYHGWLFHEIKDLFYYMQILQQENIDLPRRVSDSISISEIPDLFRTIGFYPSDFELENILIDAKYRNIDETNRANDDISFIEFVKLYCNHKPVYGYFLDDLKEAFNKMALCSNEKRSSVFTKVDISRDNFIEILTTQGEKIPHAKALQYFRTLMRVEQTQENFDFLPEIINFETLFEDILGIDMEREHVLEPEQSSDEEQQPDSKSSQRAEGTSKSFQKSKLLLFDELA
ncbi:unnamed protein product [Phyllotreta striolata]|uniref:Cilia- and flagella-associated protein 251 n=1 Tax=Phyllotreta striolata TaxID=444603 RepID=A0A9N9XSV7_PHYSR|nr:unnamed protein product [Phyllotreta striolata]